MAENIWNEMRGFYREAIRPALLGIIFDYRIVDLVLFTEHFDMVCPSVFTAGIIFKRYLIHFLGVQE
jgi:hypothetical protein